MSRLCEGRVAIVTGGGRGIGRPSDDPAKVGAVLADLVAQSPAPAGMLGVWPDPQVPSTGTGSGASANSWLTVGPTSSGVNRWSCVKCGPRVQPVARPIVPP